jgi:hypothetical protein
MKKYFLVTIFFSCLAFHSASYANWFADIVDRIEKTNAINSNILNAQNGMLNMQRDILTSQRDVEAMMKQVNASVTGNSGWGNYQFHDYQSYGSGATDWTSVMQMVKNGGGSSALGQTINAIANQFPVNNDIFAKGVTDSTSRKYYAVEAQTILATRAASQLDYDKVQDQIAYQQMLQQQIEKTRDLKAAVDLNNRIQVESNLINLQILRQSAIANQQHAVSDQVNLNNALSNAKFLTKQ